MRNARVLIATATTVAGLALACAPAAQASAYRYWTYWQAPAGSWEFATAGPASLVPVDGSVEGWRFAVTTQSGAPSDAPRVEPTFDDICGSTPAAEGSKRVAVVVDPGPAALAPAGEQPPDLVAACVSLPVEATGLEALQTVTSIRTDGGLICGLGGYPARECAPVLDDAEAAAISLATADDAGEGTATQDATDEVPQAAVAEQAPPGDPGSPVATIAVAGLLIAGAAVGVTVARRRRGVHDG